VRLKRAHLGLQARAPAFLLDLRRKLAGLIGAIQDLEPDHTDEPSTLERPDLSEAELERAKRQLVKPLSHPVHDLALDVADEPNGEVQIPVRRPAKLRRHQRARGEV